VVAWVQKNRDHHVSFQRGRQVAPELHQSCILRREGSKPNGALLKPWGSPAISYAHVENRPAIAGRTQGVAETRSPDFQQSHAQLGSR
jgi:hypothetical protein